MIRRFAYLHLIFLCFVSLSLQEARGENQLTNVRFTSAPDSIRTDLDLSAEATYTSFTLADPHRFVLDLQDTTPALAGKNIPVNDKLVRQIRIGELKKGVLRVVFDLAQPAEAKIRTEASPDAHCQRLVVELFRPGLEPPDKPKRTSPSAHTKTKKMIVIDPGHGGEDPGAIGPGGRQEKDLVLEFAQSLKACFEKKEGYGVILTRDSDCFLPLRERSKIAQDHHADLFISIHADSNRNCGTRGSSVYCLSLKGASDEATRCLAEKENAADNLKNIPWSENPDLNLTLLDLALTNTVNSSLRFGALTLREIKKVNPIIFDQPRQAGFVVLKIPEIPSVLIEVGFISNPSEARLLHQKNFQAHLAQAVSTATDEFFDRLAQDALANQPPPSPKPSFSQNLVSAQ